MEENKKCIIRENYVIFYRKNQFTNEKEINILRERYLILTRTRWSLLFDMMTDYFINNGQKGCYIGLFKDRLDTRYDVWDLSKIFPHVKFRENDYKHLKIVP